MVLDGSMRPTVGVASACQGRRGRPVTVRAVGRYVALLRGINVGGRNAVPMAELRRVLEGAGHTSVRTYLQSGNVVFSSAAPRRSLEDGVERLLQTELGVPVVVVVRSAAELRRIVDAAPDGFGGAPDDRHSDVVFLKAPL